MTYAKGDIKYYHNCGDVFMVEIVDSVEKSYASLLGDEYRLKILEVQKSVSKYVPRVGLEFIIWRARNSDDSGMSILDS